MNVETLSELLHVNVTRYNKPDLLMYRGRGGVLYNISSNEFKDRVVHFALGLKRLGVKPETKVSLLSENRPEWHIADFACHLLGAIVVPIFSTLIAEQIEYIIQNSDSEFVIVSNQNQLTKIQQIRRRLKKAKRVITMEGGQDRTVAFQQVLETGREQDDADFFERAVKRAQPEDVATIIYSSGTTGEPKGVMLTHKNIVSNFLACRKVLTIGTSDLGISALPLSHAFERTVDYFYFYTGVSILYSNFDTVAKDLREAKPTVMAAMPRFFEKMRARVEAAIAEGRAIKRQWFRWAMRVGREKSELELSGKPVGARLNLEYRLADQLVFSKIRARTGGRMKFFISGSAALSYEVAMFFYACGFKILEGYGLTETAPIVSVNPAERIKPGTVGKPLPGVEVKIADDGEILVKGPNVMKGYYKMSAATKEAITDGWFYTGDIGSVDEDGYLKITDRKKQLIVTSVGKKVAPQAIEKELEDSKYIDQVMLIGEKRKFISALIVPDFEVLRAYAESRRIVVNGNEELIRHPDIVALIQREIDEHQKHFSDYEKVRQFKLLPQPFTIESGHLTPTMKVKRRAVEQEFASLIEEMYR